MNLLPILLSVVMFLEEPMLGAVIMARTNIRVLMLPKTMTTPERYFSQKKYNYSKECALWFPYLPSSYEDSSSAFIPKRQTQLNELVTHSAGSACCASPEHAHHNSAVFMPFFF